MQKAASTRGYKFSTEKKIEMSLKAIERMKNPELRRQISETVKQIFKNEEFKVFFKERIKEAGKNPITIKNRSDAQKGKRLSKEHKLKIAESSKGREAWNKGKKTSEETKHKQSLIGKEHWNDPKYVEYITNRVIEATNTPEHKSKCSLRLKDAWNDPIKRQKMVCGKDKAKIKIAESVKKLWEDPEYRAKQLEKFKQRKSKPLKMALISKDKVEDLYLTQNLNMKQVASILKVCVITLSKFLKENNIQKPYGDCKRSKIKDCDINNLIDNNVNIGVI